MRNERRVVRRIGALAEVSGKFQASIVFRVKLGAEGENAAIAAVANSAFLVIDRCPARLPADALTRQMLPANALTRQK